MPGPPNEVLVEAAEQHGTPLFVLSEPAVGEAAAQIEAVFPHPWLLHYSLKANDLPAVGSWLCRRGWGASVVSVGEWSLASAAGFPAQETIFEGVGKSDAQLEDVVAAVVENRRLRWVVLESPDEAAVLTTLAGAAQLGSGNRPRLDVLLRLNPEVEPETLGHLAVGAASSKFGMTRDEIRTLVEHGGLAEHGIELRGVHVHVGSQLASPLAWSSAGLAAVEVQQVLRRDHPRCDTVDFGGGMPSPGSDGPTPAAFRAALDEMLRHAGVELPPRPALEPGRYLVGGAGWLVTRVLHVRERARPQVVIDAGMTELIRPALYGARHPIVALRHGAGSPRPSDVEGPVCENTDSFGQYELPPLQRGDLLAIGEAGAYAASFTSRYNGRPAPLELIWAADGTLTPAVRPPLPPHRPAAPAQDS